MNFSQKFAWIFICGITTHHDLTEHGSLVNGRKMLKSYNNTNAHDDDSIKVKINLHMEDAGSLIISDA